MRMRSQMENGLWIVVEGSLENMRERLTHLQVKGEKKNKVEEMMESYVMHC